MGPYPIEYLIIGLVIFGIALYWLMRLVLESLEKKAKRWGRTYRGTRVGTLVGGMGALVFGAFPAYQVITSITDREVFCVFRHCNRMIMLSEQPDFFWASFVIWLALATYLVGGGLYALFLVFIRKRCERSGT